MKKPVVITSYSNYIEFRNQGLYRKIYVNCIFCTEYSIESNCLTIFSSGDAKYIFENISNSDAIRIDNHIDKFYNSLMPKCNFDDHEILHAIEKKICFC